MSARADDPSFHSSARRQIRLRYKLPAGDMPPVDVMKQKLSGFPDFTTFTLLRDADIEELNKVSSRL